MSLPKSFQNFAEFEREILRGSSRLGQTLEDMVEDDSFEAEIQVDDDPFSEMRDDY
ncbi:MAG TPA: transcriptional regulator [Minicystis sp.]|nr:transcriptional regulator [Minicystis sp.]